MSDKENMIEPESVREEWLVLGHPGWAGAGGLSYRSKEKAEESFWDTPKLDGTHDGMYIVHRTITRYPAYVPVITDQGENRNV